MILAQRAIDDASLLLRHEQGAFEVMRLETGHDPLRLVDLVGVDDDLWVLATRSWYSKSPSSVLLHHARGSWQTIELGQGAFEHLVNDGARLLLFRDIGVRAVERSALGALAPGAVAPSTPFPDLPPPIAGRPWLGATDIWLTTPEQAVRLALAD